MHLRILNPCPMKWDELTGDGALRACEKCHKNVVDLTGFTLERALDHVRTAHARGQRVCGRAEVRDGRLLFIAAAAALVATAAGCSASMAEGATERPSSPAAAAAPTPQCDGGPCAPQEMWMGDIDLAP